MYYVVDENNNRIEAFDKEGVLAAINEAAANGSLNSLVADAAFISKIKCCVGNEPFSFAFVTQAKYNELKESGNLKANGYYIITDDTSADDINTAFETLTNTVNEHTLILNDCAELTTQNYKKLNEHTERLDNIDQTLTEYNTRFAIKKSDIKLASNTAATSGSVNLVQTLTDKDIIEVLYFVNAGETYRTVKFAKETKDVFYTTVFHSSKEIGFIMVQFEVYANSLEFNVYNVSDRTDGYVPELRIEKVYYTNERLD